MLNQSWHPAGLTAGQPVTGQCAVMLEKNFLLTPLHHLWHRYHMLWPAPLFSPVANLGNEGVACQSLSRRAISLYGLRWGGHHLRQSHKLPSSRVSTGPRSQFQSELSSLPTPNRGTSARPHNCGNETGYIPGRWSSPSVTGRIVCRERSDCNSPHHVEKPAARNGCKTGYESAVNHPQVTCPIHPISVPTTIKRQHASTHRTAVLDRTE